MLTDSREAVALTDAPVIRVPASIANLGPGFDTLAVAVQVYLTVRVVEQRADGRGEMTVRRANPAIPADNGVERAYQSLAARAPRGLPSVVVDIESDIPIGSGLGSSAAATIAGLRIFEHTVAPLPADVLLAEASALEGHPDNAAAAIHGGLTAAMACEDGRLRVAGFTWPDEVRFVIATPGRALRTEAARRVLPASVPMADAVFNLQRVAALLHAVTSGDRSSLREALKDRWHQPARATLIPELLPALAMEDPDLLGVCLSGAGPSIVAIASRGLERIAGPGRPR